MLDLTTCPLFDFSFRRLRTAAHLVLGEHGVAINVRSSVWSPFFALCGYQWWLRWCPPAAHEGDDTDEREETEEQEEGGALRTNPLYEQVRAVVVDAAAMVLPQDWGDGVHALTHDDATRVAVTPSFFARRIFTHCRQCRTMSAADQIEVVKLIASRKDASYPLGYRGNMLAAHAVSWFLECVANRKVVGPAPVMNINEADAHRAVLLRGYHKCSCVDAEACTHIREVFHLLSGGPVAPSPGERIVFLNTRGNHSAPARSYDLSALRAANMWCIATIPVGSKIGNAPATNEFLGFTQEGNVVLSVASSAGADQIQVKPWARATVVETPTSSLAKEWASQLWLHEDLHHKLLVKLRAAVQGLTIRSQSLHELMSELSCAGVSPVPIAIVGGSVRDVLNDTNPADIDLAVGRTWNQLQKDIREFFAKRGSPLTDASFECSALRGQHGMMKIVQSSGDKDSVDIGPFKSGRIDHHRELRQSMRTLRQSACKEEYFFGLSYEHDAMYRDYSVNAIYVDIFEWKVIDPRMGLDCYQFALHDADSIFPPGPHRLEFVPESDPEFEADLGGRIRLFKLLAKAGVAVPSFFVQPSHATPICNKLRDEGNIYISSTRSTIKDTEQWIRKVVKKLFKEKDDIKSRLAKLELTILHRVPADAQQSAIAFFNCMQVLACKFKENHLFRSLTMDNPKDAFLATVLLAWSTRRTLNADGVDKTVQRLELAYTAASQVYSIVRPIKAHLEPDEHSEDGDDRLCSIDNAFDLASTALSRLKVTLGSFRGPLFQQLEDTIQDVGAAHENLSYRPPEACSDDESCDRDSANEDCGGLTQDCFHQHCDNIFDDASVSMQTAVQQIDKLLGLAMDLARKTLPKYSHALKNVGFL